MLGGAPTNGENEDNIETGGRKLVSGSLSRLFKHGSRLSKPTFGLLFI
jgi:hypothetical protein